MEAVIRKWGNSLAIRLPGAIARELNLKNGSQVEIIDEDDKIIIRPIPRKTLKDFLKRINRDNLHKEFETSGSSGNEAW